MAIPIPSDLPAIYARVCAKRPECENEAEIALQSQTAEYVAKLRRQLAEANARIARLQAVAKITKAIVDAKGSKGRPRGSVGARKYAELTAAWRSLEPALDQCNTHNDLEPQAPAEKGTL
jgi:hypothetical protein